MDETVQKIVEKLYADNDENLAYDGSDNPTKRELTARERDILCRVISDILALAWNHGPRPVPIEEFNAVPIRVGENNFLDVLYEIRRVINPRND